MQRDVNGNGEPPPHPTVPATQGSVDGEGGLELRDILALLRRRAMLVLAATVVGVSLAGFMAWRQAPEYRATATIRIADARRALTGGIESAALERVAGPQPDFIGSHMQIARSRQVIGEAVDRENLRLQPLTRGFDPRLVRHAELGPDTGRDTLRVRFRDDGFSVARSEFVRFGEIATFNGSSISFSAHPGVDQVELAIISREAAIERVLRNLRGRQRDRTDIVDLEFTAPHPVTAQRTVNGVVQAFRDTNVRAAQQQSRLRRIFLEEQLVQTDSMLAAAQLDLSDFRQREELYSVREKFAAQQTALISLEVRREEMAADRQMLLQLLSLVENRSGRAHRDAITSLVSYPGIAGNPAVTQPYAQLVQHETALDTLTLGSWARSAEHPDVQRARAMIVGAQQRIVEAVRSHVEALGARIAALDDLRHRAGSEIRLLPETEAEEGRLVQRVETVRLIADRIREEYQRARVSEAVEAGQVEIVDLATLPGAPIGNRRGLKMLLGLLVGFMAGSGAAVLLEQMNTSIRRREEIEGTLGLASLTVVPRAGKETRRVGAIRVAGLPGVRNGKHANGTRAAEAATIVAVTDTRSAGAEAYRTLRTNLMFSRAVRGIHSMVISSASPAEGKSTTAANLAVTFAQKGMRVLLIDADLRKPRLHAFFGLSRGPGLSSVLGDTASVAEATRRTAVEGLNVMTAGPIPPNPVELLSSDRMRDLLRGFVASYDLVIVDSPPVLAAADASVLATLTDGMVMVVRAGSTQRGAAKSAVDQMRSVGARMLGAVLNDPDSQLPSYGGYYTGYYQYEYYGEEAEVEQNV